jgi:hypothetical protein
MYLNGIKSYNERSVPVRDDFDGGAVDIAQFDKTFLFYGKSIRKEKGTVKEKHRAEGKGTKGVFL